MKSFIFQSLALFKGALLQSASSIYPLDSTSVTSTETPVLPPLINCNFPTSQGYGGTFSISEQIYSYNCDALPSSYTTITLYTSQNSTISHFGECISLCPEEKGCIGVVWEEIGIDTGVNGNGIETHCELFKEQSGGLVPWKGAAFAYMESSIRAQLKESQAPEALEL